MLPLKLAELLDLEAAGSILLLLGRRVVPAFALGAFKNDDFAHGGICFLRPVAESLQRRRPDLTEEPAAEKSATGRS